MVRNYKRKTNRGKIPMETFEKAYNSIINGTLSLREAAKTNGIDKMTLMRYKIKKESKSKQLEMGYAKHRQVLSDNLEFQLKTYIVQCSKIYYGLTPKNIRELAYELAIANKVKIPDNWKHSKIASREWFTAYMKRHPDLSIREPEGTSLSRATSFNKHNVNMFFNNLKIILEKYKFQSKDIWNTDETGIQTVQKPGKIVAEKGTRQVAKATSAERGTTLTLAVAVNAIGNSVPPMFIFPRVYFKDHFIQSGPPGCIGTSYPTGWMTAPAFTLFLKHFHSHVKSTKEHKCLLVLDNHESHMSIEAIVFCKENGIVLLSFPPHTSHRLQPLDKSVYGPFKKFYYAAVDNWMMSNPGKTLTIYDIPGIVSNALPNALTPKNIISGFKATGIMPFNPDIFKDEDFLSCSVTDRLLSEESNIDYSIEHNKILLPNEEIDKLDAGPSSIINKYTENQGLVSPEQIRPFPKAKERKQNKRGKKPMKSQILTDTPVKDKIQKESIERENKKMLKKKRAQKKLLKSFEKSEISKEEYVDNSQKKKKKKSNRRKCKTEDIDTDSEDEDSLCLMCLESFSASKPGQEWIQCISCKKWAHLECSDSSPMYTCVHCQSDQFSDEN